MKTQMVLASCIIAAVFVSGCSKPQELPGTMSDIVIRTSYDPQAQFPRSATYAFLRRKPEEQGLSEETRAIVRRVRDAIKKDLASKRYRAGTEEQIDFIVDYQIVAQHSINVIAERSEALGQQWITVVGVPDNFIRGGLVIDVIDTATLKPVWRGLCDVNIALAPVSEEEKQQRARYAVKQLLKTFPPK
jgi:hypothetical protein